MPFSQQTTGLRPDCIKCETLLINLLYDEMNNTNKSIICAPSVEINLPVEYKTV